MHVDLVESLRCPNPHGDGWLVASADRIVARRIIEGLVGCPECGAEWPIRDGELDFRKPERADAPADDKLAPSRTASHGDDAPVTAERLAALLHVVDPEGAVALLGSCAMGADALHALTGVQVLAVNAPREMARSHSRIRVNGALPLGVGTLLGVQCDGAHATQEWLLSACRAVRRGGRVVAPSDTPVPAEVQELARDAEEWVGEVREAASGLVPLRRGGDPMRLG